MKEIKIQESLDRLEELGKLSLSMDHGMAYLQACGLFAIAERLDRFINELEYGIRNITTAIRDHASDG